MLKIAAACLLLSVSAVLAADAAKSESAPESEFTPLTNGKDLTGWIGATAGYEVKDGVISFIKGKGGHIYTEKEYADFVFRFEFKLEPGSNNGVAVRAPAKGDPAYSGMEIQILDDGHEKYKGIQPWQVHGSVYGISPAKRGALKPAGEWNEEEIIANGRHIKVTVNGQVINDVNLDEIAPGGKTIDGKNHPGMMNKSGHLGFAGHGDNVQFRNLRIKELNTDKK
jgi:hypothetical protein